MLSMSENRVCLCLSLPVYLSVCLSICLSVCLSVCLTLSHSLSPLSFFLSIVSHFLSLSSFLSQSSMLSFSLFLSIFFIPLSLVHFHFKKIRSLTT